MHITRILTVSGLTLGLGLLGNMPVSAEGSYLGLGWGRTGMDDESAALDTAFAADGYTTSTSMDDSDGGLKLYGGHLFNDNWGLEVGYLDFGTFTLNGTESSTPFTYTGDVDANAWYLAGVLRVPFGTGFAFNAKAGFARWKLDAAISATVLDTTFRGQLDDSGTSAILGLGGAFDVTDALAIRVDYDRVAADENLDMISLSVQLRF
ncbi:outer membrane beta-barrel protein [Thiohalobacter sp. IOR34]|uniref:outer membrane beta-barrel protein n=1 Tax=Thiohalobacter sp. IOR34 TaxID=3057176 RepID=UPI0025B2723F|nr:outer membrane beta-barrel protein [Thiohalobacter sp. IOR34]WJW75518.1 outer membrane beta-barrel protein [Thiohalobacter sp. IOR34]